MCPNLNPPIHSFSFFKIQRSVLEEAWQDGYKSPASSGYEWGLYWHSSHTQMPDEVSHHPDGGSAWLSYSLTSPWDWHLTLKPHCPLCSLCHPLCSCQIHPAPPPTDEKQSAVVLASPVHILQPLLLTTSLEALPPLPGSPEDALPYAFIV